MKKTTILLFLILSLSFIIRLLYQDPWYTGLDSYSYYTNAGKIYAGDLKDISLWVWFIGYPLLISLFFVVSGVSLTSAVLVSTLLGALTVLVVYLLGRELMNEEVGLLSALMVALSPTHAYLSSTIMSDVPALFFVVLSVFCYVKFMHSNKTMFLYLSSIFFGWSVLVKYSNGILILLPFLHKLAVNGLSKASSHKIGLRTSVVAAFILVVVMIPQLTYNYYLYGNPLRFTALTTDSDIETDFSLKNAFTTGYLRTIPPALHYPYILFFKYNILPPFFLFFYVVGTAFFIQEMKKQELTVVLLLFALPFILLISFVQQGTPTRYAIIFLLSLAVLASAGVYYAVKSLFGATYPRILALVGLSYLVMIVPTYWMITDNVSVHGVEESFQLLVHNVTEDDAFVVASPHHLDAHIQPIMGRDVVDLRVALAGSLDNIDPGIDYDLKKLNDSRSPREKLASISSEHPHLYVLVSYYGNEEVENLGVLEEYARLKLLREEQLRLSMMSPWRAYSIALYRVEGLK